MPIPIKYIEDSNKKEFTVDYSFLTDWIGTTEKPKQPNKKVVVASDKDASLLFQIWSKSTRKDAETYSIDSSVISNRELIRLKTRGFVVGDIKEIKFTRKGKAVIGIMALNEPSTFEKIRQEKSYNEILANMSKAGKPGYRIPKFAANNSNNLRLD